MPIHHRVKSSAASACSRMLMLAGCLGAGWSAEPAWWVHDPMQPLAVDAVRPAGPPTSMLMVAPRGGVANGAIAVAADAPVPDLAAAAGALSDGSGHSIAASQVQIRWATSLADLCQVTPYASQGSPYVLPQPLRRKYCDVLADSVPGNEKTLAAWFTVAVPPQTVAGVYRGQVTVRGRGLSASVPMELTVGSFLLPSTADRLSWLSISQSPDTVAWRYNVPLYGDQHLRLLDRSFRLLGQLGNHVLYVPVLERGLMGNSRGLVQFRLEADVLRPDFTAFDAVLAAYLKYNCPPRMVILQLWENWLADPKVAEPTASLTVRGADGALSSRSIAFPGGAPWRAVADGMRERLVKAGCKPDCLVLGTPNDYVPRPEHLAILAKELPGMKWARFTHGYGGIGFAGGPLAYVELPDPSVEQKPVRLGKCEYIMLNTVRDVHSDDSGAWVMRSCPDIAVGSSKGRSCGFARAGLDFWPVPWPGSVPDPTNRNWKPQFKPFIGWRCLYPPASVDRLYRSLTAFLSCPGPDGALGTTRLEGLREGIQEVEARLVLEKLLSTKLPEDRKAAIESLLLFRAKAMFAACQRNCHGLDPAWHDHVVQLYAQAGSP